jgi:hypothetical protein
MFGTDLLQRLGDGSGEIAEQIHGRASTQHKRKSSSHVHPTIHRIGRWCGDHPEKQPWRSHFAIHVFRDETGRMDEAVGNFLAKMQSPGIEGETLPFKAAFLSKFKVAHEKFAIETKRLSSIEPVHWPARATPLPEHVCPPRRRDVFEPVRCIVAECLLPARGATDDLADALAHMGGRGRLSASTALATAAAAAEAGAACPAAHALADEATDAP